MYEQMLDSSRIEVRVWRDLEQAAAWLGVKPESLKFDFSSGCGGQLREIKESIKSSGQEAAL